MIQTGVSSSIFIISLKYLGWKYLSINIIGRVDSKAICFAVIVLPEPLRPDNITPNTPLFIFSYWFNTFCLKASFLSVLYILLGIVKLGNVLKNTSP